MAGCGRVVLILIMSEVSRERIILDFKKCGEVKRLLLAGLPDDFRFVLDDETISRLARGIVMVITLREGAEGIGRLLTNLRQKMGGQFQKNGETAEDLELKEEIIAAVEEVYRLYSEKSAADFSKTSLES